MARTATTQHRLRNIPTKSKPNRLFHGRGRTQPNRGTRAQHADSGGGEENEDSDGDGDGDGDDDEALHDEMDVDGDGGGVGSQDGVDINLKANQLVRLALFMEHKRMPLRRDDISKKVFGPSSRASRPFNRVLERAQLILNRTFGMELIELQSRAAMDKAAAAPDPTALNEEQEEEEDEGPAATQGKGRGKATGLKKKALPVGGKSYILRSILHPTIISFAALPDEEILSAELDDAPDELNDDDDGSPAPSQTPGRHGHSQRAQSTSNTSPQTCTGTLLSFSSSTLPALENAGALGIQYVLLSLILASGRLMSDRELRAALRQLHLPPGASVPLGRSAHNHLPGNGGNTNVTIEAYLQLLVRQGYIDRISSDEAGKPVKTSGGKRGRASANIDAEDGENKYDWRWGPRAHSEIGEKAIQEFISEFMVENSGRQDNQDGEGARVQERLKKMMNGIEKAAGGNISDIK